MVYLTRGYIVAGPNTEKFDFDNTKLFGPDNKNDAVKYINKEKSEGRRWKLYRLVREDEDR